MNTASMFGSCKTSEASVVQYWNPKLFPTRLAETPVALARPIISRWSSFRKAGSNFARLKFPAPIQPILIEPGLGRGTVLSGCGEMKIQAPGRRSGFGILDQNGQVFFLPLSGEQFVSFGRLGNLKTMGDQAG